MQRKSLKLAIVAGEWKHQSLAVKANLRLPPEQRLSELNITQLVTNRRDPTPKQAAALARVLGRSAGELFPLEAKQ